MGIQSSDLPIFMIGMGRSGSTILAEAFSVHDGIGWFSAYLNNFPHPWITIFDRFVSIPKVGIYLRGKKKQGRGAIASIRKYLPRITEPYSILERYCGDKIRWEYLIDCTATEDEKANIRKLARAVLKFQGKKRLFSKFTGPPRIHYLNSIFPDAYYIHVIRDPRAVVSSLLRINFWLEEGGLIEPFWKNGFPDDYLKEWQLRKKSPVALAALQWKRVVELTWMEKQIIRNDRYIEIKYEDFITAPHDTISRMLRDTGLGESDEVHRYISLHSKPTNMNYKYLEFMTSGDITVVEDITRDTAVNARYAF
jgi:omega-hydroxy-beta-dihydromenaquinone-9 sulfotransferase